MPVADGVGRTIRDYLKVGTAAEHDRLDSRLGTLVSGSPRDYTAFLDIQYRARLGIEDWLAVHCTEALPPPQTGLIARDLAELGCDLPAPVPAFAVSEGARTLGICWVLAGSALGNRMILTRIAKAGVERPAAFLSDPRMGAYWRSLLPRLEAPANGPDVDGLLLGAQATFAHFNAIAAAHAVPEAA